MIRFIDMGRQIWIDDQDLDCPQYFAFWDTVTNRFLEFGSEQAWSSWEEFEESLKDQYSDGYKMRADYRPYWARCRSLCPEWVFKTKKAPPNKDGAASASSP
jgi:hypothetical protein